MHWEESSCGGELFLSYLTEGHRRVDAFQTHLCPLAQKSRERKQQQEKKKKDSFWFGVCLSGTWAFFMLAKKKICSQDQTGISVSVRFPCCPRQPNDDVLSTRGKTQDCNLASELEDITFPMCLTLTRKLYNL